MPGIVLGWRDVSILPGFPIDLYGCAATVSFLNHINIANPEKLCERTFYYDPDSTYCACLDSENDNESVGVDFPDLYAYHLTVGESIYILTGLAKNIKTRNKAHITVKIFEYF